MRKLALNANQLKIIAVAVMLIDHLAIILIDNNTFWGTLARVPGRIAAPIMCYMIAEGYHHTSNRKKYLLRLLIFAVISHLPYNLCFGYTFFQATSIIWALAMGLVALMVFREYRINVFIRLGVVALCCFLARTANWNYAAVLWILAFGIFYGDFKAQMISFSVIGVIFHLIPTYLNFGFFVPDNQHWYQLLIFIAIPVLALYKGACGKRSAFMRWFFYVFYPAHLLLLYLLRLCL